VGDVPEVLLLEVAAGRRHVLDVPGAGLCRCLVVPLEGTLEGHFVLARSGEEGFSNEEAGLLRGMARVLTLALRMLRVVEVERELRERSERQAEEALHDALTGLPNRGLFFDRLERALTRAHRGEGQIALLFMDMDRFKTVNDSLGHAAGDELLEAVAARLRTCLRDVDTAARLGGDEFAILLEDVDGAAPVSQVAHRILETLRDPFLVCGREVFANASLGIALDAGGQHAPGDLLRNADVAMYRAKTDGKGRFVFFEPGMEATVLQHLELEGELRRAVEHHELVLHYQPIYALASGRLAGVEALLRWQHPTRGLVGPDEFITLAEETGLVAPIGRWVLEEACRQLRLLEAAYPSARSLTMSVNLSPSQLRQRDLVAHVTGALRVAGLAPERLALEITEGVLVDDVAETVGTLENLKGLGVSLGIDDFGTGYSSLSYLQRLPVDLLKIDKSFVDSIAEGAEAGALARAIIRLADTLHLRSAAEGIETAEQLHELQRLGCTLGQGYYFARPLDVAQLGALLADEMAAGRHRHLAAVEKLA
jgi:diguanylate cyclase (GGDEF)-like protein